MSAFEARVTKLEARQSVTAERAVFNNMSDEVLERFLLEYLIAAMPEEIEADLVEHPEFCALYAELLPRARKQRESVEVLIGRTPPAAPAS